MTKKELSQLYYLNIEIRQYQRRIRELEAAATNCNAKITGLPHGTGINDKVGKYAAEIADLRSLIELDQKKCMIEIQRLNRFIRGIDDSQMRTIFSMRYIDRLTWQKIAFKIGEHDESYPRRKHNRFLKVAENTDSKVLI